MRKTLQLAAFAVLGTGLGVLTALPANAGTTTPTPTPVSYTCHV